MYHYWREGKIDMVRVYYECDKNKRRGKLKYRETFSNRVKPNENQFVLVAKRLGETGFVENKRQHYRETLYRKKNVRSFIAF
ncbi:hypothetical protein ANTPLA_LOCUS10553 [Anthophora plagiata]